MLAGILEVCQPDRMAKYSGEKYLTFNLLTQRDEMN